MLDFIVKMLAIMFLKYNETMSFGIDNYLMLTYNRSATNSELTTLGYSSSKYSILFIFFGLIIGIGIIICKKNIKRKPIRGIIYFCLFIGISTLIYEISLLIPSFTINNYLSTVLRFIGPLFLISIIVFYTSEKVYVILWSLLLGAGLGNFINQFYPPFAVIDYLYIGKFHELIGLGVFNVADIVVDMFIVLSIIYFPVYLIQEIIKWRKAKQKKLKS
jgi:lipoprotein signal peptidase